MKFPQATTAITLAFAVAAQGISASLPEMDAAAVQRCISQSCGRVQTPETLEGCWERCMDLPQEKERWERMQQQQGGHGRRRGTHLPVRRQAVLELDPNIGLEASQNWLKNAEGAAAKKKHKQELAAVLDSLGFKEVDEPESEKRDLEDGYEEELEWFDETESEHRDEDGTRLAKGTKAS